MSTVTPFRIYSKNELQLIADHSREAISARAREYCGKNIDVLCDVKNAYDIIDPIFRAGNGRQKASILKGQNSCICIVSQEYEKLAGMLLKMPIELGKPHVRESHALATFFLASIVGETASWLDENEESVWRPSAQRYGRGWAVVDITMAQVRFLLFLRPEYVDSFLPARPVIRSKTALVQRREAISCEPVVLSVQIGTADISVGELRSLHVGDVVMFHANANETIQVFNAEGLRVCSAYLGKRDDWRAVQLVKE